MDQTAFLFNPCGNKDTARGLAKFWMKNLYLGPKLQESKNSFASILSMLGEVRSSFAGGSGR